MPVQQDRARRTRTAIVRSAAREFDRNGYTATSVDTILEGSGVTKGAFYFHFPSKELLAVAIVEAMHVRWAPAVRHWAETDCDALQVVLGLVDEMTVHSTTDALVRAGLRLTTEQELAGAGLLAPYPEWERIFRHLFQRAQLTGLLRPRVRPATAAHVLVAAIVGERDLSGPTTDPDELRARTDELLGVLIPAFACEHWVAQWEASDWSERSLPAVAAGWGEADAEDGPTADHQR